MEYELYHWGIKGMKWGIRRFQNKNGSLTAEGKKRYDGDSKKPSAKVKATIKSKSVSEMSDEDIQKKIDRLRLEKTYNELVTELNPKNVSKGKQFVSSVLETSGKNIGTQLSTYVMGTVVNKLLKDVFKDPNIVNPKKGQKDK